MRKTYSLENILPGHLADSSQAGQQDRPLARFGFRQTVDQHQFERRLQAPDFGHSELRGLLVSFQEGNQLRLAEAVGRGLEIAPCKQADAGCLLAAGIGDHGKLAQPEGKWADFPFSGKNQAEIVHHPRGVLSLRIGRGPRYQLLDAAATVGPGGFPAAARPGVTMRQAQRPSYLAPLPRAPVRSGPRRIVNRNGFVFHRYPDACSSNMAV